MEMGRSHSKKTSWRHCQTPSQLEPERKPEGSTQDYSEKNDMGKDQIQMAE